MSRILGIDYGDRRVGIAVADTEVPIAFPRETIDRTTTDLFARLEEIIRAEHPVAAVIGLPVHPDGRSDGKDRDVRAFAEDFRKRFDLVVHFQDEAYSSLEVKQRTKHFRLKDKKDKGRVDRAAAALILQSWLDNHSKRIS